MPMHVALLRGVNVVGNSMVAMSDLRDVLGAMGFTDVRSLLQSGNLIFRTDRRLAGASLERLLETATAKRLGRDSPTYMVRSAAEWNRLIDANPFPGAAKRDPSHLLVMFLKTPVAQANVKSLRAAIRGLETIEIVGKHLYVIYPDGVGKSKFTHGLIERHLATRATGRNWNTVVKLAALLTLNEGR
jgi:uncharacterized protein (DUF1697 family)